MSEWCRHGNDWKDLNFFKHWVTTLFLTWLKGVTQIKWKCTHFQSRGGLWTLQQKLSAAAGQTTQHSIQHGAVNSPAVWWIWMGKGIHNHKSCAPLVTSNGWPCAKNHRSNFGCSSFIWCWNPKQCIVWQSLVSLLDVLAVSSDIDSNSNWPWPHSCSVVFWVHLCVQCILQFTLAHCKDWWCILMGNSQGSWHPFNCESQCNQWDSNGAHCVTMVVPWKAWKQQTSSLSWHWNETKQEEFEQLLWCWHGFGKSSQTTAVAAPCKQFVASHQLNHPLLCLQHMLWCHFFSCCCRTLMLHTKKVIQHSHPAALWALICQPSTVTCLMLEEVFSLLGAILSVQAAAASVCCCFSLLLKHKSLLSSSEKAKSDKTWQCGTSEHTLGDKAAMAVPVARVAATMSNGFLETLEATTTLALPWLAKPNKKEKMDHESPLQDDKVNDPTLPKTLLSSGSSIMVLVLWHSCLTDDHGVSTSVASTSKQVFSMSLPPVVLHSKLDAWNRLISVSASSSTSTWSIVMIWLSWIIVAFVMASHWHLQMVNKAMTAIMMQLARMVGIKTLSLRKLWKLLVVTSLQFQHWQDHQEMVCDQRHCSLTCPVVNLDFAPCRNVTRLHQLESRWVQSPPQPDCFFHGLHSAQQVESYLLLTGLSRWKDPKACHCHQCLWHCCFLPWLINSTHPQSPHQWAKQTQFLLFSLFGDKQQILSAESLENLNLLGQGFCHCEIGVTTKKVFRFSETQMHGKMWLEWHCASFCWVNTFGKNWKQTEEFGMAMAKHCTEHNLMAKLLCSEEITAVDHWWPWQSWKCQSNPQCWHVHMRCQSPPLVMHHGPQNQPKHGWCTDTGLCNSAASRQADHSQINWKTHMSKSVMKICIKATLNTASEHRSAMLAPHSKKHESMPETCARNFFSIKSWMQHFLMTRNGKRESRPLNEANIMHTHMPRSDKQWNQDNQVVSAVSRCQQTLQLTAMTSMLNGQWSQMQPKWKQSYLHAAKNTLPKLTNHHLLSNCWCCC